MSRQATVLRDHATAVPDRHPTSPDPSLTGVLVDAIALRRRVRLTYRGQSGREFDAEVDPWAVVARHGRWYLRCHSHRADSVRTYRLDRVRSVEQTQTGFTPPEGLDPVARLEENLGSGWKFCTRVRFAAPMAQVAPWIGPAMGRLTPDRDGCLLSGSTSDPAMYAGEWLAAVPFDFVVEDGPELRAAVVSLAARFRAAVT